MGSLVRIRPDSLLFFILLWVKALIILPCLAEVPRLISFDDYITQIYQRQNFTEEQNFESIRDTLQEAYARPLNLNKLNKEEVEELGILSQNQIKNYFHHIATTGPLYSQYELQAIPDFDLTTIALLLPFVYIEESYATPSYSLWKQIINSKNNYFLLRYEPSFGTAIATKSSYKKPNSLPLGSLDKYTVQLSLKHTHAIALGVTARKQAGESFCWDHATNRYGFNLWSVFCVIEQQRYFKRIVIGDYQIGYGQGLLLSAGYVIEKGSDIVSIIRSNNIGIRPYKGIKRIGLRGIAITTTLGPIESTLFYATNNLDATIKFDEDNKPYTNRINYSGKYDTIYNLQKKGTINEQVIGGTMRYHKNQTEVGINLLYNHYDIPISPKESSVSSYLFQGQYAVALSLFYRLLWKNVLLFGEGGLTFPDATIQHEQHEKALIVGCLMSLSRYVDCSIALYCYGSGFYSPYGNAFKFYTSENANEKGGYVGIKLTPLASWQLSTNGHFFSTLRPKPRLAVAASGHSFTTRSSYTWNRATLFVIQHKLTQIPKNRVSKKQASLTSDKEKIAMSQKNNLKFKVGHKFTHYWWTNIEVQYMHHNFLERTNHGYALSNTQKWKRGLFQFLCKVTYFNSEDYVTRLYFYEANPLYSSRQFRPYCGNGVATSWLICWKPIRFIRLELAYGLSYFFKSLLKMQEIKMDTYDLNKVKQRGAIQFIFSF